MNHKTVKDDDKNNFTEVSGLDFENEKIEYR